MAAASRSLDDWRRVFSCANSNIFELIEKAILVAAEDCPKEFFVRRISIAEKLFCSQNSGWDHVKPQVPVIGEYERREEVEGGSCKRELGEKDRNVKSSDPDTGHLSSAGVSNYSYEQAEALTIVIEEESLLAREVLRIKEILCNKQEESEAVLYESLRRLEQMQLSIETLKATQIGRAVNGLRKHYSKQIRTLVRSLIDGWKLVVDKWVDAAAAIANVPPKASHDFGNPSVMDDEVALSYPPMDGGDQLVMQTTTIHFSEASDGIDVDESKHFTCFDVAFDGIDVDENNVFGNLNKMANTRQVAPESCKPMRQQESLQKEKSQETVNNPIKFYTADSGTCGPLKLASEKKPIIHFSGIQRKPLNCLQENSMDYGEAMNMVKLEITKRKLREGYQQAEQAKKQRTTKFLEQHELPEQPKPKPKKKSRKGVNKRQ